MSQLSWLSRHLHASACLMMAALATFFATPARAYRCDDLAAQIKGQIDGVTIGRTAGNVIYLAHPSASQVRLGCANRNVTNEFFAESANRNPAPEFLAFVASAAAIVFTIPRDDTLRGTTRCMKRLGILRGDNVASRFRRLDMTCTRTKTNATISISRDRDT